MIYGADQSPPDRFVRGCLVTGGKRRAGRDHNRGSGRSDEEEEDSASSSSDDDDDDEDLVVLRQRNGSKRRQDDLELGLEQYAGESKRVRTSTRERKANLWTLDAHLHYLSIWLEYLNTYKYVRLLNLPRCTRDIRALTPLWLWMRSGTTFGQSAR
jgi:hypothetical protein